MKMEVSEAWLRSKIENLGDISDAITIGPPDVAFEDLEAKAKALIAKQEDRTAWPEGFPGPYDPLALNEDFIFPAHPEEVGKGSLVEMLPIGEKTQEMLDDLEYFRQKFYEGLRIQPRFTEPKIFIGLKEESLESINKFQEFLDSPWKGLYVDVGAPAQEQVEAFQQYTQDSQDLCKPS